MACNKDEKPAPPTLKFGTAKGYCSKDTTVLISQDVLIELEANSPDSKITCLSYRKITTLDTVVVDSGMNVNSFNKVIRITKDLSDWERWEFKIRNKNNEWSNVAITLYKDAASKFGHIVSIPLIRLGAQNNSTIGSFFGIGANSVFNLNAAYNSQSAIDLLYCYDFLQGEANTIASPGANIDSSVYVGSMGITKWALRNETRFVLSTVSVANFDNAKHDSILIANTFVYPNGKRKCKNLKAGDIYVFIRNNKIGMLKVLNVQGTDAGTIDFSLKIQE